jgi:hypothetical protein
MSKWMNVTRVFAAALIFGFCANTLMAKEANEPDKSKQKTRGPEHPMQAKDPVEHRLAMMTKQLDLTKEQQTAIKPILEEQFKQMNTLREDKSIVPEQRQTQMQQIIKDANAKIEKQLKPEQKEKFAKQQERMKEQREKMLERKTEHAKTRVHDSNNIKK